MSKDYNNKVRWLTKEEDILLKSINFPNLVGGWVCDCENNHGGAFSVSRGFSFDGRAMSERSEICNTGKHERPVKESIQFTKLSRWESLIKI